MTNAQKDDGAAVIVWQSLMPLPDTVRHEEELQGALRGDMDLFDEAEKKTRAWIDRRQLAVESGLKALGEMSACTDPVSAATIYGRWLAGSLNGIAEDLQDAQDFAVKATAI